MTALDGAYSDATGKVYAIKSTLRKSNDLLINTEFNTEILAATFQTECGKKASAITMDDGSNGMILEDGTTLSRVTVK